MFPRHLIYAAHFKTEKSETEFHAVQAKDSDIEIKEVENKEIFDETFEISVKKDTEISETEKKHDGGREVSHEISPSRF
jgi:hypothetical protein